LFGSQRLYQFIVLFTYFLLLHTTSATAQQQPMNNGQNGYVSANDSAGKKTNTSTWSSQDARIYYTKVGSEKKWNMDTSIHSYQRRPFSQPWLRDLGNLGSPIMNLFFTPENPTGLSLGYHTFDPYRFNIDSLPYFNTTRAYSVFTYQLGSKLEQVAQIMHTQNIKPNWNFAFNYRKINSPGYYLTQRNNHDNFYLTSNYTSLSQHYQFNIAFVYNKEQHDENGGITSDTFLNNSSYSDRKSIPTNFQNSSYSSTRSPVTTLQRDISLLVNHSYTWGSIDTAYNKDSTQFTTQLTPRFRIAHRMELTAQKYLYKDVRPDSIRYSDFFQHSFNSTDSVFIQQNWTYLDNRILLNGLLGKKTNQLLFNIGIGNRIDQFKTAYLTGSNTLNVLSNYVVGAISKEALQKGQWEYTANTKIFLTGDAAGNFELNANVGKDLGANWGDIKIGVHQQLNNAPYSYTTYENQYWSRFNNFDKESTTQFYATINSERYHFSIGAKNYVINNYLYFDSSQSPKQYSSTFNIAQICVRKLFVFGHFTLDNEIAFQQVSGGAPVNVPAFMGRHQLAIEKYVLSNKLKIATGIEVRYHSDYYANGYTPFFNHFYYQNSYRVSNNAEASIFFNFKIKRFRAYFMIDQLQQLFKPNIIITEGYAAQNTMLRFGFSWALVN
jgi:hypothetical protein